jgi:hypothetical protein
MIGDFRFHRRSDAERLVNPGEVVMHEMESDSMGLILNLLAECIRKPSRLLTNKPFPSIP